MESTDIRNKNELQKEIAHLKVQLAYLEEKCDKYEKNINNNEVELQQIIDLAPYFIFAKDEDGKYILANKYIANIYNTDVANLLGKTDADFAKNQSDAEGFIEDDLKVINLGSPLEAYEEQITNSDGEVLNLQTTKIPFVTIKTHKRAILGLSVDITKQKEKERALIAARKRAEESALLKSTFLNNLSHEIRTPLNGIIGFAALLEGTDISADDLSLYVELITSSSDRLLKTINDLMDISMIETDQVKVVKSKININKQLEALHVKYNIAAERKSLRLMLSNDIPTIEASLYTDEEKFEKIFSYLISNAIKFSKHGTIEFGYHISQKEENHKLVFFVKDMGIGIPINRQRAIFHRFVQSVVSDTRVFEGSGLGLSITKSYVEMLGGEIWLESEEGIGSTFYFSLPYETKKTDVKPKQKLRAKKPSPKSINDLNLKILIAEDEESISLFLKNMLKDINQEIIHAKDGEEALEIYKKTDDIDLILMDIRMPKLDGYEVSRRIREIDKDIKIIAQTAFAFAGDKEKAINAGCDDYLTKPLKKEVLLDKIFKLFAE